MSGKVIRQNWFHADAPSIVADSNSSPGMARIAASWITR
jgi:hypothetical protein